MSRPFSHMPSPRRILVVPLRFIGDVVLTVPLLRALKAAYPEAHLDVLTTPATASLLEASPYVDDCVIEPKGVFKRIRQLQARRYDLAVIARRSVTQALICKLSGVKYTVGFDEQRFFNPLGYRRWGCFLDAHAAFPPVDTHSPHVEVLHSLLKPLISDTTRVWQPNLELWVSDEDKQRVADLFSRWGIDETRPVAVIHLSSASREKAMPVERFIPSIQRLSQAGYQLIALGTADEAQRYDGLARDAGVSLANACGKTTLCEAYALLLKTQLLFTLDSAPVHMAAAAQVPGMVVIYGPTNEHQWRPYPYSGCFTPVYNTALTCRPCEPKICSHNRCREDLSSQLILEGLNRHLTAIGQDAHAAC